MSLKVAANRAGSLGPKSGPFPAGRWVGDIDEVRVKELPPFAGESNSGYTSTDGEVMGIQLGNIVAADGREEEVGGRKFFLDIVLRDGTLEVTSEVPDTAWRIYRSQDMLVNLGRALGHVDDELSDGFVEALKDGQLNGSKVGFEVYHRKTKSEKRPIVENVESFFVAA